MLDCPSTYQEHREAAPDYVQCAADLGGCHPSDVLGRSFASGLERGEGSGEVCGEDCGGQRG